MVKITVTYEYEPYSTSQSIARKATFEYNDPETVEDYQDILVDLMRAATFHESLVQEAIGNDNG